jgi:hypothetical protein
MAFIEGPYHPRSKIESKTGSKTRISPLSRFPHPSIFCSLHFHPKTRHPTIDIAPFAFAPHPYTTSPPLPRLYRKSTQKEKKMDNQHPYSERSEKLLNVGKVLLKILEFLLLFMG